MTTIEIDDDTATMLNAIAIQENVSVARLLDNLLNDWQEDNRDIKKADIAYQRYLDGGKKTHSLEDVERELGLDS